MGETLISVVIPTIGRLNSITKCISSILKQTLLPHEIIIVDSSKNTNLDLFLKRRFPIDHTKIRYIHSQTCLTEARNIGVRHSLGGIIFFFDDDVVLDKNYIKEVVKVFMSDKDGKIGGVMGNITNSRRDTNSPEVILKRFFFLGHFGDGKNTLAGLPTWVHGQKQITKTDFLSGCMMAYRKEVLQQFTFDEKLGKLSGYCYLEDVDISYRVSRKSTLVYTPFAELEHHTSAMGIGIKSMAVKRHFIVNHFYLFNKNIPKHLSNVLAFCLSIFGFLLLTLLFGRNPKGVAGSLRGIIDVAFSGTSAR